MSGKRLYLTIAGLVVLAVLALLTVLVSDDDDEASDSNTSTTVARPPAGPLPDDRLAATLLPPVSALGTDWIETQREDAATAVEPQPAGASPAGPIAEGFLIRGEQRRTAGAELVETLSITAGVLAEGTDAPSLDDQAVVDCLQAGLQDQVPEGSTVTVSADDDLGPVPEGAEVSHVGYRVSGDAGAGGAFEFVLVQRGRLISLGLLTGVGAGADTALAEVVAVLDQPLAAAEARG